MSDSTFNHDHELKVRSEATDDLGVEKEDLGNEGHPSLLVRTDSQLSVAESAQRRPSVPAVDRPASLADRVLSRITSTVNDDPGPAPDGGLRAWMCGRKPFTGHLEEGAS